jgi:hypothetical protein
MRFAGLFVAPPSGATSELRECADATTLHNHPTRRVPFTLTVLNMFGAGLRSQ